MLKVVGASVSSYFAVLFTKDNEEQASSCSESDFKKLKLKAWFEMNQGLNTT
jgi:hypothetical protein